MPVLPVRDNVHFPRMMNTLLVGRELSRRALDLAVSKNRLVLVVGQRDRGVDDPRSEDLFRMGVVSEVIQVLPMPDGTFRAVLRGLYRAKAERFAFQGGSLRAEVETVAEQEITGEESEALRREILTIFEDVALGMVQVPPEALEVLPGVEEGGHLADSVAHYLTLRQEEKQALLEELDAEARLESLARILARERRVLELQAGVRAKVEEELGQTQREYYLREQLKVIQQELGGTNALGEEGEEYRAKILACQMPEEVSEKALGELRRLERAPASSPEGMVIRSYLDWLVTLPWSQLSKDRLDVRQAARVLERDHFGLTKVKDRILDFLAVRQLNQSLRGPILCFVGPPGVGKTSIGRSIAEALGRQFVRLSLGGVRDEAEIRGHRRTYVGSMPGRLIQSLKTCGTRNPVVMLDEIDKLANDFRGDPTSALLEALDPEQNARFSDHYIEVPFDLNAVMFIATANLLENIPAPLRDRMEVIRFPSYTEEEKLAIARKYLVPKLLDEHGLTKKSTVVDPPVLREVIRGYTREAGVRQLERELATVCRKVARRIAEGTAAEVRLNKDLLKEMLGQPRYRLGSASQKSEIGVATGLVYTEYGGDVVRIEVSLMPRASSEPKVLLTGSLGEVMKESAMAAVTYVRSRALEIAGREFDYDVHVHVPEGAVPKDGPSAGLTITVALISAFTGRAVRSDVAMTGEITLTGRVLPVGGVREKALAAHRAGIREIILPEENNIDRLELQDSAKEQLEFSLVSEVNAALERIFL